MSLDHIFILLDEDKRPVAMVSSHAIEDLADQWQAFEALRAYADIEKD